MSGPEILKTVSEVRAFVSGLRAQGKTLALVPTMGALHEGHLTLVETARKQADVVIVSIFVNPTQFAPHEDYAAYPRTLDADVGKLAQVGVQAVYAPDATEMYAPDFSTKVLVSGVSEGLCGASRPIFFAGVATVVTKLLLQVLPDVALFGEKDYQQLQVITRLVEDLNIPVRIAGVPTVRNEDGLALSSRNAYLDEAQYKTAICLNKVLFAMAEKIKKGGEAFSSVRTWGTVELEKAGFEKVDYLEIMDAKTLTHPVEEKAGGLRILVAAWIGKARLIDNVPA